ncbi:MAG: small subunit ribosomal protein [Actinomycetota bacterium]
MTTYEILLLLDPELAEERQNELIARVRELVDGSGGTWRSHDPWGRRRLTYEIRKKSEGVYHLLVFQSSGETLDEITRVLKIDDGVLRHMATRHIEGSRTSAPRDDAAAVAPAAAPAPAPAPPPPAPAPVAAAPEPAAVPDAGDPDPNDSSDDE